MEKSSEFLEDKIFELINTKADEERFKFVHLKVKQLKEIEGHSNYMKYRDNSVNSSKKLIQIIDMSDKMLYNEVKAEQTFLTLINATVSHELRNPLASLIGQRE